MSVNATWIAARSLMRQSIVGTLGLLLTFTLGCTPSRGTVTTNAESSTRVARSGRLFDFHSDPCVSLHHFLYNSARVRAGLSAAGGVERDTAGLGSRTAAERAAWNDAIDYYVKSGLAERDAVFDSLLKTINATLADAAAARSLRDSGLDPSLVVALDSVAPIYHAIWWSRHDAANRAWIASMLPLIARYGETLAVGVANAYEASWPSRPIRVDVMPYANWAGAYGTAPPRHVVMSTTDGGYKDTRGVEMLFHEASHTIADSLATVLRELAAAAGKPAPFGVLHPIIFFTAGS